MYTRQDPSQQWTVHAQFTISHDGINDPNTAPQTHTEQDENGVRMVYSWTSQPNNGSEPENLQQYQKGNMVFTTTPPTRRPFENDKLGVNVDSSGYSSELLSPNSFASSNFPRRSSQPYNRRCRSTCSIVLSTDFNEQVKPDDSESQCGRTHSLRCQTPTLRCERKEPFYGCGDPWCYHSNYGDDLRFSPVPEGEEYTSSSKRPSRASTYTAAQRSKSSPPRFDKCKDASVQTYEMIDKCTSPFMKMGSFDFNKEKDVKEKEKKKRMGYNSRRKTEPIRQRSRSPSSITPDSLESQQTTKRAVRAPARLKVPSEVKNSYNSNSSDPTKKPRTVHIDVYCTGTEVESSSSTDSDEKTGSSPQTVFESGKVRITHKRAEDEELPFHLRKKDEEKAKEDDSELEDGVSTTYPSRSSFSEIRDIDSSFSSVPPSWSTMSMSSYAIPDDDSIANTSWKDTVSDFGSLSRSSITQTDSLDFVPRKLYNQTRSSIDEYPEIQRELLETPSSLQPSDSFEYANSDDKFRIKKMENLWNKIDGRQWKSPQMERKHLLQQQKMKEYIEKKICDKKDTESESDTSEKNWSFIKDDSKKLERDETVRRASNDEPKVQVVDSHSRMIKTSKSPSILIIKQKMSKDPGLRAPFTVLPGIYTEQRYIAKKFGQIVDVFKKPGHHIGPAKNPDCTCDHCRCYFENLSYRGRTRSVDSQLQNFMNWKEMARGSVPRSEERLNKKHENLSASELGHPKH